MSAEFRFGPVYRSPNVHCCGKWNGHLASCSIPNETCIYAQAKREAGTAVRVVRSDGSRYDEYKARMAKYLVGEGR